MKKFTHIFFSRFFVKKMFESATFRQSAVTFSGTFITGLLGAAFYILSARLLGPALFGTLSVSIVVLSLVADLGDMGVNTGLVRFISKYANENFEKANRFIKLGLVIKLSMSLVVISFGYILAPLIANKIFFKSDLVTPLRISFIGVGTTWLFSFITVNLQAFQRFWKWSGVQILTNLLRLVVVVILFYISKISIQNNLLAYITIPFIGFMIGLTLIPKGFLKVNKVLSVGSEFFQYNKWIAIFIVFSSISSRLDTFLSARFVSSVELGLYSAAIQLTQVVPLIIGAIGTVIAPKMSGMRDINTILLYFKKTQIFVLGISVLGLLAIPVSFWFIPTFYGDKYMGAVPVFTILLIAMLVFLISVPIHNMVLYYFSYPKLFTWVSMIHFSIILILGWVLVRKFGVIGIAYSVLFAQISDLVIPAVWVYKKVTNHQSLVTNH